MTTGCRDCREGWDHCHGTVICHSRRHSECTESGCTSPELVRHGFVIDCDAVGCDCSDSSVPAARQHAAS